MSTQSQIEHRIKAGAFAGHDSRSVIAGWNAAMAERERATAVLYAAIRLACSDGWIPVSDEEREMERALIEGGYIEHKEAEHA
jgi:hypothetical protein